MTGWSSVLRTLLVHQEQWQSLGLLNFLQLASTPASGPGEWEEEGEVLEVAAGGLGEEEEDEEWEDEQEEDEDEEDEERRGSEGEDEDSKHKAVDCFPLGGHS